jgi:lactoylglutathione lyase
MDFNKYVKGIHHIGIPVLSMEKTKKFYLGLGASIDHEQTDEFEGRPIKVTVFVLYGVKVETYERPETAGKEGAIDHVAFEVADIDELYKEVKEAGYKLMNDCRDEVQTTSYWPATTRWFIIIGPDGEKLEFTQRT